jgi:hypothetical protein
MQFSRGADIGVALSIVVPDVVVGHRRQLFPAIWETHCSHALLRLTPFTIWYPAWLAPLPGVLVVSLGVGNARRIPGR